MNVNLAKTFLKMKDEFYKYILKANKNNHYFGNCTSEPHVRNNKYVLQLIKNPLELSIIMYNFI